jgi:hypothetical protein
MKTAFSFIISAVKCEKRSEACKGALFGDPELVDSGVSIGGFCVKGNMLFTWLSTRVIFRRRDFFFIYGLYSNNNTPSKLFKYLLIRYDLKEDT